MARVVYSAGALRDLEVDAVDILAGHPRIGRRVHGPLRELVISHGQQREAGYQD